MVACNGDFARGIARSVAETVGRRCWEILDATDAVTGKPCLETCPLNASSGSAPEAHWRGLIIPWHGESDVPLHCFAMPAATQEAHVCMLLPPDEGLTQEMSQSLAAVGTDRGPISLDPRLRVFCFGAFEVEREGERINLKNIQRLKALKALKYLVAHRRRQVPRDELMEVLWPNSDPSRTAANLRVVLCEIRRMLEPSRAPGATSAYLISRGEMLALDHSDRLWVDVEAFEGLSRQVSAHLARGDSLAALTWGMQAIALYKGDYLEDEPYGDWCLHERHRLKEVCLEIFTALVTLQTRQGRGDEAMGLCRRALQLDESREVFHRQLISLLLEAGKRDEAVKQYAACKRALRRRLGVAPGLETQALIRVAGASTGI